MALLSFWTIPYVSIDDKRLVYLYNVGFVCVLGSLFGNIFLHQTYLDSDVLHGISEARLKTPADWSPATQEDQFCKENLCVKWDAGEVGYSHTSDNILVTTRIIDNLENTTCDLESKARFRELGNNHNEDDDEDTEKLASEEEDDVLECAEYKRISKKIYYPYGVEDFNLILNAFADAPEFCSHKMYADQEDSEDTSKSRCPYIYALKKIPGELVSYDGSILETFNKDQETSTSLKDVPVLRFLKAAGVNSLDEKRLRDKGGVFLINVKFHLDYSQMGYFTGLLTNPNHERLPTKFTVQVKKLTQGGYKIRELVGHTRTQRRVLARRGLQFKMMVTGKAYKFSWSKLLSEIVLNFGLFGVISTILDLLWQIVFPLVGFPDYNDLVYNSVQVESEEEKGEDNSKECEIEHDSAIET